MQKPQIVAWSKSDVGRKRNHNEDSCLIDQSIGLFAVADGMGGYEAGDVASHNALDGLHARMRRRLDLFNEQVRSVKTTDYFRHQVREFLDEAVQEISYEIFTMAQRQGGDFRMGTTLCSLVALNDVAAIVHVGDSRCYLWREHQLYQVTEDHSLVHEQLKMGLISPEEAASSRYKNVITRAVGMADRLQADVFFIDLRPQDRFVLCSDGLHGYLQGDELSAFLSQPDLSLVPEQLIDFANKCGGKDNITAIVIGVEGELSDTTSTEINDGLDVLSNNPLFAEMTYQEMLKIMPFTTLRSFAQDETLVREGEPSTHLFIVQEGSFHVYRSSELVAELGVGSYIGEMGVFDRGPTSATVIAKDPSRCLEIASTDLFTLIRQEPDIGLKIQQSLIRVLCDRLRNTTHALAWTRQEWRRSIPDPLAR